MGTHAGKPVATAVNLPRSQWRAVLVELAVDFDDQRSHDGPRAW